MNYEVGDLVRIIEAEDATVVSGHIGAVVEVDAEWVKVDIRDANIAGYPDSWWVHTKYVEHV